MRFNVASASAVGRGGGMVGAGRLMNRWVGGLVGGIMIRWIIELLMGE